MSQPLMIGVFFLIYSLSKREDELFLIFVIIGILMTFGSAIFVIESIIRIISPFKIKSLRKFGNAKEVEKIFEEIFSTIEYDDGYTVISKNYVVDKDNFENILEIHEINRISEASFRGNRKSMKITHYSVEIHSKFGNSISILYEEYKKKTVAEMIDYLNVKIAELEK